MPVAEDQPLRETPSHPEEIRADYELRLGKLVTVQASARITPGSGAATRNSSQLIRPTVCASFPSSVRDSVGTLTIRTAGVRRRYRGRDKRARSTAGPYSRARQPAGAEPRQPSLAGDRAWARGRPPGGQQSLSWRGRCGPIERRTSRRTPATTMQAEHGADLEAKDADGRTPLDLARGNYSENFQTARAEPHVETVALLERLIAERAAGADSAGF